MTSRVSSEVEPKRRVVPLANPADALTALRIVLVPIFFAITMASGMTEGGLRIVACIVFCVASATDYVDGWIARTWDLVTSFGKVADPIADKALTGSALVLLSAYGHLPWWVTVLILARELRITALRFVVIRRGIIPASRAGKIKTVLQIAAISFYLWPVAGTLAEVGP